MPRLAETYGRRLEARRRQYEQNLRDMKAHLKRIQYQVLNTPYPPASRPGHPPHRRSEVLRDGADVRINPRTGGLQLVNSAPHAGFLQKGTRSMRPRPYQDLVFDLAMPGLAAIERRGMPFGNSE